MISSFSRLSTSLVWLRSSRPTTAGRSSANLRAWRWTTAPGTLRGVESVTLGQVIHNRRDRLIYLFDMFGDRAYFLELTGTFEAEKGASYPREIYAQAAAPDQYDPSKTRAEDDDGSIFGEVMSEFSDFEGDDNYDDEY